MNVELLETLVIIESIVYKSNGFAIYLIDLYAGCKKIWTYLPLIKPVWA